MESYFNKYKIETLDDILANAVHNNGSAIGQNLVQLRRLSPNASYDQVYQALQQLADNDPDTLKRVMQVPILKEDNNANAGADDSGFDWTDVLTSAIGTAGSVLSNIFGNNNQNQNNGGSGSNSGNQNNQNQSSMGSSSTWWIVGGFIAAGLLVIGLFSMASRPSK